MVPAVGFGMGDVTLADFLESHGLIPEYSSEVRLTLASVSEENMESVLALAQELRASGVNVATDTSNRSVGDKIKNTLKLGIPFFVAVGEDEITNNIFKLKNLALSEERTVTKEELVKFV